MEIMQKMGKCLWMTHKRDNSLKVQDFKDCAHQIVSLIYWLALGWFLLHILLYSCDHPWLIDFRIFSSRNINKCLAKSDMKCCIPPHLQPNHLFISRSMSLLQFLFIFNYNYKVFLFGSLVGNNTIARTVAKIRIWIIYYRICPRKFQKWFLLEKHWRKPGSIS